MKKQSKSSVKETAAKQVSTIESVLKNLKLDFTRKKDSFTVDSRNAIIYNDNVTNTFVVLNKTTGAEMFANKSASRLEAFLDGGSKSTTTVKETKAKTEKVAKVKEPKVVEPSRPRYSELKPVEEVKINKKELISLATQPVKEVNILDHRQKVVEGYKGIFNTETNKVVSVVSDTYNLLPNKVVVDPVLEFLEKNKIKYIFDRFSYVNDTNMRLHFTFPEIKIKDDSKDGILGSMFLHNSYNNTESFNMTAGALRLVCKNGMVANVAFKKLKVIHQAHNIDSIALANMEAVFNGFHDNTKMIEQRIKEMIATKVTGQFIKQIYPKFEVRIAAHMLREVGLLAPDQNNTDSAELIANLDDKQKLNTNMWKLYNILTQYISHQTLQRYRLDYLRVVSKQFAL